MCFERVDATILVFEVSFEVRVRALRSERLRHVSREVEHPVVVIDLLAERGKRACSVNQFVNFYCRTDVLGVAASRPSSRYAKLWLCKKKEFFDDGRNLRQLVERELPPLVSSVVGMS